MLSICSSQFVSDHANGEKIASWVHLNVMMMCRSSPEMIKIVRRGSVRYENRLSH